MLTGHFSPSHRGFSPVNKAYLKIKETVSTVFSGSPLELPREENRLKRFQTSVCIKTDELVAN